MKDLKHLIYFEDLLQEAQNELVTQAVNEGKLALGYNCYYIPEVLLNLPGCFSSRLRAPRCSSPDIATYYMTNRNCPYVRSILERAIEGGYNYLSALFGAEGCAAMERMEEHFFLLNPVKHDNFFVTIIDPPMKGDQTSLDYYKAQLMLKVVEPLRDKLGVDVSEDAMRRAVSDFNELCRVVTEIGSFRKLDNPPITGYEFHVIQLVSQVCPHELILPYLKAVSYTHLEVLDCIAARSLIRHPHQAHDQQLRAYAAKNGQRSAEHCLRYKQCTGRAAELRLAPCAVELRNKDAAAIGQAQRNSQQQEDERGA